MIRLCPTYSDVPGAKSFALWPLYQAAQACFGTDSWPDDIPAPHARLEFDVENVETATAILDEAGYRMLVKNKQEPWGQPFPLTRRTAGRGDFHPSDAGQN